MNMTEKKKITAFQKIMMFLMLFVSEDVFVFGAIDIGYIKVVRMGIQLSVLLMLLIYYARKPIRLTHEARNVLLLFGALMSVTMFVNSDIRPGYFFQFLIYFICTLMLTTVDIDDIFEMLLKWMVFLCWVSVIMFFVYETQPGLLEFLPTAKNTAGIEFYVGGISNIMKYNGGFTRNFGAFREPGVFQMFILMSLYYASFRKKDTKLSSLIILMVALITTFSTTGYIAFCLYVFAVVCQGREYRRNNRKVFGTVLLFLLFAIIFFVKNSDYLLSETNQSVFGKFTKNKSASFDARYASIYVNLKIFSQNPVFGKGVSYTDVMFPWYAYLKYGRLVVDNTNTILIQMAKFGIFFFAAYMYRYIKFFKDYFHCNRLSKFYMFLSLICLFIGENLGYSFLFALPMFYTSEQKQEEISG